MTTTPHAQRRARVAQAIGPDGIALIPTAPEYPRNRDNDHLYRHDSYFYYLTGFTEPNAFLVITGDGDMLMSLSSLATVAAQQPDNLAIVVLDNEKFGETGNQASHTSPRNNGPINSGAGADLAMIARGCGIADTGTVTEQADVAQLVKDLRTKKGPVFRLVKVMVEKLEFVMPPQDGAHLKDRFRQALRGLA